MSRYIGETYSIPLERGGFCHNKNIDSIDPSDMVDPSCNVWLNEGGLRKRGGTAVVDTIAGEKEIVGIFDFWLANGNQSIVRATSDGKIWKTNEATIKTGWTANRLVNFVQSEDTIYACNGANTPVSWNGTDAAVTNLTVGVKAQGTITMTGIATVGVKAQGTITMTGTATAYQTFVINKQTFTWKTTRVKKGDVTIGATAAEAVANIAAAINADMQDEFTADDTSTSTVVVTSIPLEASANTLTFTEASDNMTMDGTGTFGGTIAGVDEETFVIDEQTFTWKAEREDGVAGKGQVTIGATAAAAVTNLVTAINEDMDIVEAEDGAGNTVLLTAKDYDVDMNDKVFTEASTNMAMNGTGTFGGTTAGVNDQMPTDWTGSNYPSQFILHGRGNSLRNWALGCPLNPKTIYVSVNGDLDNFSQATVLTFRIETGDGSGIVGGIEYGDRLMLFGKTKSFIMEDLATDSGNWGYTASQFKGGAAHQRLIVKTPNDIVCMMENGEIYSVMAAESYGDYKSASLSRPSFLHEWIKTNINLPKIADFHAIYDPVLRAIKIFCVRVGQDDIDTALVYFIDRSPDKAWVILQNTDFDSGYSACSSAMVRQSVGVYKLYTGGYNGKTWRLGELNRNDNSNAFIARIKTPHMSFEAVRESKRYDRLKVVSIAEGSCDADITWWIDGKEVGDVNINFASSGDVLGTFVLGVSVLGGLNILESSSRIGATGRRIQIEAKNNIANESFFLSQFLIDFVPLGKRA
jgi:hypothetical protein